MRLWAATTVIFLTAALSAPSAMASGTSGGSFGTGSYPILPHDPAAEAFARGKAMVRKHISCKKCAYPEGVQDTPTAQKVAGRVKAGEFALKPADREKILYYLSRRFGA